MYLFGELIVFDTKHHMNVGVFDARLCGAVCHCAVL